MDIVKDLDHLGRRQQEELNDLNQRIGQMEIFKRDYKCLRDRVEGLPDKTRHDVMVPIAGSRLAFMPGYIHHTNEFMVLIGEDYFVEMSAKQTLDFVDRKLTFCDENIKELEKNRKLVQDWFQASKESRDSTAEGVEFVHQETEEEYEEWLKKHRSRLEESSKKKDNSLHEKEEGGGDMRDKEKFDVMKFLDKYKDEDEDEDEDSDDDPTPVVKSPAQIPAKIPAQIPEKIPTQIPAKVPEKVPAQILPKISEQIPPQNPAQIPQQDPQVPAQSSRPISKFRASRMKQKETQ